MTTTTTAETLFQPVTLGAIELANRVVMAPLTRMRSGAAGIPGDLITEHYRQRAGLGLIITEGTYPSFDSQSYAGQPGIASDEQAEGWRRVADAVHADGGKIVVQIMHGGRTSHPDLNGGRRVMAPSAIAIEGELYTGAAKVPFAVPEAMTAEEIRASVADHVAAARRAIDAGLDGVEIHAANGYLLNQFLAPGSNHRTDEYGGSPQNRARFVVEVVTAVAEAVGAGRVGVRISPQHERQDAFEPDRDDVLATYGTLLDQLKPLGLAYLSLLHGEPAGDLAVELQRRFGGKVVFNSGFSTVTTVEEASELLRSPFIDAVAVGRAAIANPDLVARWQGGHPENEVRADLFYGGGAEGYTDYPYLPKA
ncbi:alkene reductase [Actinoplanes couchii]|uniref:Alkene reductase n=1 Tax=Actinoplanes couchii TaxID=403638 RepID=A0ABQ3XLI4_9ACTN|nr:alkene reductase [Actinoplanes couchii]MDR6318264.1 2,4-dienoyl-CoA reductase-like NADH-dependent reductase (Old Yellow Enzyme family) [Actinoplanes couchii]GID59366.1 alkene reductase [Actinoplanes couchii]